jgi:hypothetical protein
MAEKLFYYLLALTLASGFFLIYDIVLTELRSRRERREWERLRAAQLEIKRMRDAEREQQERAAIQERGYDSPQVFYDDALKRIQQLQREINQRVRELDKSCDYPRVSVTAQRVCRIFMCRYSALFGGLSRIFCTFLRVTNFST